MSSISDSYQPNLNRYRYVEFPIYSSLVYFGYLINNGVNIAIARYVSIIFSLGSLVFVFLITRKYFGKVTATFASLTFGLLPYNIYFSRVVLPEPSLIFFCLGMFYFVDRWIWENKLSLFFISIFFTAAAFLIKPTAIFYLVPLLYSYFLKENKLFPIPKRYLLFMMLSFLPFVGWRLWILQHPEGIPAAGWLLNGNHIRFKPAFWKWIIGDRFGREILSAAGTFLFFLGLLIKPTLKESKLLHLLMVSLLLYLVIFATGNVQHDYYQTLIIPGLSIFVARAFVKLLEGIPGFLPRIMTIPFAILFFSLTFLLTWYEVKGLYQINNFAIVRAGIEADKVLPKDAVVLAPYQGDSSFLYQINRRGFAILPTSLDKMINEFGVTYYVSVNYNDDTNFIIKKFKVIEKTPEFVIVDLKSK